MRLRGGGRSWPRDPRKWVLLDREAGLPDDEDAAGRWSVDHVFVDQDAIPTLVEVKRSSDTRIRREVVVQGRITLALWGTLSPSIRNAPSLGEL
jgi:hypothetical protein